MGLYSNQLNHICQGSNTFLNTQNYDRRMAIKGNKVLISCMSCSGGYNACWQGIGLLCIREGGWTAWPPGSIPTPRVFLLLQKWARLNFNRYLLRLVFYYAQPSRKRGNRRVERIQGHNLENKYQILPPPSVCMTLLMCIIPHILNLAWKWRKMSIIILRSSKIITGPSPKSFLTKH